MSQANQRTISGVHYPLGDSTNPQNLQDYLDDIDTSVAGKIGGSTGANDNRLLRSDGAGGLTLQSSGITVSDADAVSGVSSLSLGTALSAANGGTGATSAAAAFDALAPTTTQGDIIYRGSSTNARLAVGTSGQFLQTQGAGANPQWATVSHAVTAVASGAVSAAATLDIAVSSAYDMYEFDLINWAPATDNAGIDMLFSQSGSFLTGASDYVWSIITAATHSVDEADARMAMSGAIGNNTNEHASITVRVFRPGASSFIKSYTVHGSGRTGTPASYQINGGGSMVNNSNAIDAVRFKMTSGNIASGYYSVRGYTF